MVDFTKILTDVINKTIDISTKINKTEIAKLYTSQALDCEVIAGAKWENCSAIVKLCANKMSIYFDAERKSFSGSGDVVNEVICTLKINTRGVIKEFLDATGVSASAGGVATFFTANGQIVDNILTVDIMLSAAHGAVSASNGFIENVIVINPDAYI